MNDVQHRNDWCRLVADAILARFRKPASRAVRYAAIILLFGIGGCTSGGGGDSGGGGGGGVAPVTQFSGPLTDIDDPVAVAPRYTHLQFDGAQTATTSSGPRPPGDLVIEIDPDAGIVGITRLGDTTDFAIDFDNDSQVFDSGFVASPPSTNHRATMLIPGNASDYLYTSYGVWARDITSCLFGTCGSSFFADAFYFGSPTQGSGTPIDGQAVFDGTMHGYYSPVTQSAVALSGDATLNVDFGAKTVTGSFHNISTSTILGPGVGTFNDIAIDASISGSSLTGTVTGGPGATGPISGDFFGPAAAELGGVFQMTGNGHTIGAFAAQQ